MNNTSTRARLGLLLPVLLLGVALAAWGQQYIESLKIGGGYGSTGIDLTASGDIDADGDITANAFIGDGSGLTGVSGSGDVTGPASSTDNAIARFDSTTGKVLQNSGITIADGASGTLSGTNTGDQTISLTGDVTGSGTGSFATTIAAGAVDIAMLSATGTPGSGNYLRGDGTWATPAGSGDVSKVGAPADGQIGVWTGDGTIEGDASLTFDTTDDTLVVAASGKIGFGAVDILTDSSGTTTLNAIDAVDATTESTVETAIDTLANLTSIQGQSVTVSGTTTVSGTNSGDVSLAGTPDYITISGQTITRGLVDQAADITGITPVANGGTGATTLAGASIPTYTSAVTLTNKRITPRVGTTTSSATPSIDTDAYDVYVITALAVDITSMTSGLSGTPTSEQPLRIAITGTAARAITWGASFENGAADLPTTTVTTQRIDIQLVYNAATSKWRCMAAGPTS